MNPDIAAGIVVFHPERALVLPLVRTIARQAAPVFVLANAPLADDLAAEIAGAGGEIITAPCNLGVAEAQNICVLAAALAGKARILLLDQDSSAPDNLVSALATAFGAIHASGARPAVIGPRIVAPPDGAHKAPHYFPAPGGAPVGHAAPVRYVISSGSLIDIESFRRVGAFRSDFFIDAIDTEWCFRAWARDASCWVARDVDLQHRIGDGVMRHVGRVIPRQADFRLYAYVRNQTYCLTRRYIPFGWKLRLGAHIARVVLASWIDRSLAPRFLGQMIEAASRGLAGKLGPPPGARGAATLDL